MKLSDGVEWGLHCGVLLGFLGPDVSLPTARLAEYHGVPAASRRCAVSSRLATARTSWPASTSRATVGFPMTPVPPVTNTFIPRPPASN